MSALYRVRFQLHDYGEFYQLGLMRRNQDGTSEILKMVPQVLESRLAAPEDCFLHLSEEEGEQLMLALATEARRHGFRPPLEAEETAAIRKHLEDMRALAFHKIGAAKP